MEKNGLNTVQIYKETSKFFLRRFLSEQDLSDLKKFNWLAYTDGKDFLSLFVSIDNVLWESHWWGRGSSFKSLTACRKSIKMFFEDTGVKFVLGRTPCENIKALKMARILGYQPIKIDWAEGGIPYLISRKENL